MRERLRLSIGWRHHSPTRRGAEALGASGHRGGQGRFRSGLAGSGPSQRLGLLARQRLALRELAVKNQRAHQNCDLFCGSRFLRRLDGATVYLAMVYESLTFPYESDRFAAANWFDHWTSLAQFVATSIS